MRARLGQVRASGQSRPSNTADFECRYRYARSSGVNNAFWVAPFRSPVPEGGSRFEIDVNEGHYPDKIGINVHNWSDTWVDQNVQNAIAAGP